MLATQKFNTRGQRINASRVLAISVFLGTTLNVAEASTMSSRLCVQTFNAYGPAYAANLEERTSILGRELEKFPCEIIQLQEVWTEDHHIGASEALGQSLPALSAARFDDFQKPHIGQSGLAIFTSEVLSNPRFEMFNENQDGLLDQIRAVFGVIKGIGSSLVTLRRDENISLQLMNVHLHPSSQEVRITQVVQILENIERRLPLSKPLIISGDFNFKPDSAEYALLRDVSGLTDSYAASNDGYSSQTCTYCISNPNHWPGVDGVLDYIWFKSSTLTKVEPSHSFINLIGMNGIAPSDHYGVRTYFNVARVAPKTLDEVDHQARISAAISSIKGAIAALDESSGQTPTRSDTRQKLTAYLRRFMDRSLEIDSLITNLKFE